MLTGALYAIIGIKTKWIHVFLSTAYIFALAVTILIEFVMHTPVSNAAQGAYFVAACVTGLIAGGVSLLFKDITEGISCFLGGFCFSMVRKISENIILFVSKMGPHTIFQEPKTSSLSKAVLVLRWGARFGSERILQLSKFVFLPCFLLEERDTDSKSAPVGLVS